MVYSFCETGVFEDGFSFKQIGISNDLNKIANYLCALPRFSQNVM